MKQFIRPCRFSDTAEWNAEIAYKQAVFQALGITDGFYSKGKKVGTLEELKK